MFTLAVCIPNSYRLNSGVKAANDYATAKYSGIRGNDLKVIIQKNVDDNSKFDVSLYLGTAQIDNQTVASAADLLDNDFVVWKKNATLAVTVGVALTGGTNGTVDELHIRPTLTRLKHIPSMSWVWSLLKAQSNSFTQTSQKECVMKLVLSFKWCFITNLLIMKVLSM